MACDSAAVSLDRQGFQSPRWPQRQAAISNAPHPHLYTSPVSLDGRVSPPSGRFIWRPRSRPPHHQSPQRPSPNPEVRVGGGRDQEITYRHSSSLHTHLNNSPRPTFPGAPTPHFSHTSLDTATPRHRPPEAASRNRPPRSRPSPPLCLADGAFCKVTRVPAAAIESGGVLSEKGGG